MKKYAKQYDVSDHFDGSRFYNPNHRNIDKNIFDFLKWKLHSQKRSWPEFIPSYYRPSKPLNKVHGGIRITFINHVTFLIQVAGINILTDPVFSYRVGPFDFIGPKRIKMPGIALTDLPDIDYVLITHNHYDHLDITTLQQLEQHSSPTILLGLGNARHLNPGHKAVTELDWHNSVKVNEDMEIIFFPALHWSSRKLFDRNKALWGSYVIKTKYGNLFFAGDTGYDNHFKLARDIYKSFEVAMLPIGSYLPRWFMVHFHMSPAEAIIAHLDLGAKKSIAMHFGTFDLADDEYDQAIGDLNKSIDCSDVQHDDFIILEHGQCMDIVR